MIKKSILASMLVALFVLTGCDYNNRNFEGYDNNPIADVAKYEGDFTGTYPTDGYFSDRTTLQTAVNKMLKTMFSYCDSGSTAKVSLLYGDVAQDYPDSTFKANLNDTLKADDYKAIWAGAGIKSTYSNFSSSQSAEDINRYISVWLNAKYPYVKASTTCNVTYAYYASKKTTNKTATFKFDGSSWAAYSPYAKTTVVTTKVAEMVYTGSDWKLVRLLGGSKTFTMATTDYQALVTWVKANHAAFLSTQNPETEEYYTGSSAKYSNINNKYDTWKSYYNIDNYLTGKSNTEIQGIMDAHLAEGIIAALLPTWISTPDPGLSYVVIYKVYGGDRDGNNAMTFMYNADKQAYEKVAGPVAQK